MPEERRALYEGGLRTRFYRLIDAAGLPRGRFTGLALKGEALVDADQPAEQISLDQTCYGPG
ncbi:hypothetical protein OG288_43980 [Streptomyces tauricus]|uniref:Uncharacterized protein n=1 Tax=Streptomyces tauricus TaxID=68274 RepID=A0ABZ1JSK4_9ACTN|nr:hypothetical protein [Streptomyces tauricus]